MTTVPLGTTPSVYQAEERSSWNVSLALAGSTSSERWQTDQPTAGVANSSETVEFTYHHQLLVTFGLDVSGGGTGYAQPAVNYSSFGAPQSTAPGTAVWADAGSSYSFTNPLPGSSLDERWDGSSSSSASGSIAAAGTITTTYYHQDLMVVDASFNGSELFPSLTLRSTSEGAPYSATVVLGSTSVWVDANSTYSIPQVISVSQGERWMAVAAGGGSTSGSVSGPLTIHLQFERQDFVALAPNTSAGGSISASSGWYDAGVSLQVEATASAGWRFEGWAGTGATLTRVSTSSSSGGGTGDSAAETGSVVTILVNGPVNETATFYPELEIVAAGPLPVYYQDGATSGTVPAGATTDVYLPPSTSAALGTSSPLAFFFYSFQGWTVGGNRSLGPSTEVLVTGPQTLEARSTTIARTLERPYSPSS